MTVMAFRLPFDCKFTIVVFALSGIFKRCTVDGVEEKNLKYRKRVSVLRVLIRLI